MKPDDTSINENEQRQNEAIEKLNFHVQKLKELGRERDAENIQRIIQNKLARLDELDTRQGSKPL